jgi:imidazolonepropionase-like amidohydrolase
MTITITRVRLAALEASTPTGECDVEFNETISAIRPAGTVAPSGTVVLGEGRFLLPGLIDTHVHLGSRAALDAAVHAGLTTVVDLGTYPDDLISEQRAGRGIPSIISAGSAASAHGGIQVARMGFPADSAVSDPADAERYLDWRTEHGSDLIKIIIEDPAATDVPALGLPTIAALVAGAHRRGLLTVAHVVTAAAFDRGLDAGVDILTHTPLDRPLSDATVRRMAETGTISSPTLVMMRTMARARLGDRADLAFANALESVRRMVAAGIYVIAGTDANETPFAPVPHGASLHEEMNLLHRAGMTRREALTAATSHAASALRLTDRGRILEGLRADLLLIAGDPVLDPTLLARPDAVWVAGERVSA